MPDAFRIIVEDRQAVKYLTGKGDSTKRRVIQILNVATNNIKQEAKDTIRQSNHIWMSRLINSIMSRVTTNGDTVIGEVFSGTDYSIYVHEGAKKHYTSFVDSNGMNRMDLVQWAIDKGLIETQGSQFISTKTRQPIRGITVGIEATKFLTKPYQKQLSNILLQLQKSGGSE